jgi:hypothetical protein
LQVQGVLIFCKGILGLQFFSFATMLHKAFSLHSSSNMQVTDDIPTFSLIECSSSNNMDSIYFVFLIYRISETADTILKKYSSTVATIFTGLASVAFLGQPLTVNFLLGISIVFISMHQVIGVFLFLSLVLL